MDISGIDQCLPKGQYWPSMYWSLCCKKNPLTVLHNTDSYGLSHYYYFLSIRTSFRSSFVWVLKECMALWSRRFVNLYRCYMIGVSLDLNQFSSETFVILFVWQYKIHRACWNCSGFYVSLLDYVKPHIGIYEICNQIITELVAKITKLEYLLSYLSAVNHDFKVFLCIAAGCI